MIGDGAPIAAIRECTAAVAPAEAGEKRQGTERKR